MKYLLQGQVLIHFLNPIRIMCSVQATQSIIRLVKQIYIVQKSARIQDPFKNTKSSSNKAKAGCDSSSLSAKSPLQHPRRNMVLFDSETVRWLNHVVEKIWPVCMEPIVSQKILLPSIPWFLEKYKPWTVVRVYHPKYD
ncbi:uncharacterized protein LOC114307577 isoform X3 [Camellia sinensis]|uniref:uncharacterized protein LOC114307577 isoform X3 n=1 Tax=Camellia sinensis TaxID=4442 RepID=UPI001035C2BD|nr:uncharacterized protein LOC114307577 isoform X3 [Camellia sinensis]